MPDVSLFLRTVHGTVHVFDMKRAFSEPKIYTGGADAKSWSKLPKKEQRDALAKDWYVYYSFRDPSTGKLKRQPNIKAGANRYGTKRQRYAHLRTIQRNLTFLLEAGFSPYADNTELEGELFDKRKGAPDKGAIQSIEKQGQQRETIGPKDGDIPIGVTEALEMALSIKKRTLRESSFIKFRSRAKRFGEWVAQRFGSGLNIALLDKRTVMEYLNEVLQRTSARNRNNARADLSSLFQTLEDNEIIAKNVVKGIPQLRTQPKRNKTYSPNLLAEVENLIKENDPLLLLFVRFVSYCFLRPIEVCRLRVRDIDVTDKKLYLRTKTKLDKTKIIPDILLEELPDISRMDPEHFLFTPEGIGGAWDTSEENKRGYFTKRFKVVKEELGLGMEYGLYSFRHTYITQLYRKLAKDHPSFVAKSKLLPITGHSTMDALEKYLRDIDAELPDDYSHLFEK
ncbi:MULTISPECIES: tyrosine-type recombinase/integrase [Flavobacteriaceae]|nr:tyrosine-type recombinase/integrase [Muricauda sp. SP22]MDC6363994.1 tyrosine-type recombinase/integrase [Muricauda sp. SP22]